jgi:hypothetical protein
MTDERVVMSVQNKPKRKSRGGRSCFDCSRPLFEKGVPFLTAGKKVAYFHQQCWDREAIIGNEPGDYRWNGEAYEEVSEDDTETLLPPLVGKEDKPMNTPRTINRQKLNAQQAQSLAFKIVGLLSEVNTPTRKKALDLASKMISIAS